MDWTAIANTKVSEITGTRAVGRPVNSHVVPARKTPVPDYDRMQSVIKGAPPSAPPRDLRK